MANRISRDLDLEILTSLALGKTGKEVASTYGVSTSYVSNLKTGKKIYNVTDEEIKNVVNNGDYTNILIALNSATVDINDILNYAKEQFKKSITHAKMWEYLIDKINDKIKENK